MKRGRSPGLLWDFILVYASLVILTCLLLGSILLGIYVRNINQRAEAATRNQASHAVSDLEAQLESMRMLSLKLSVQRVFAPDTYRANKANEIELLSALSRYQAYCGLSDDFALIYRVGGETDVFRSEGSKADLAIFLGRHSIPLSQDVLTFLLESSAKGRVMRFPAALLLAFPVRVSGVTAQCGTLCFVVSLPELENRIALSGDLTAGSYTLSLEGQTLLESNLSNHTVFAENAGGFRLEASVPRISVRDLFVRWQDAALFSACLLALFVCVVVLAYRSYRPIRSMLTKYATGHESGAHRNEWAMLDQVMAQMRSRSQSLDAQVRSSRSLLRNYSLLMLLSHADSAARLLRLDETGLELPYPLFCVLAVAPDLEQRLASDSIQFVASSMDDVAEGLGALYAVELDHETHTLALLYNFEQSEQLERLLQRLRAYLRCQAARFTLGVGQIVDSPAGISASCLTALDFLEKEGIRAARAEALAALPPEATEPARATRRLSETIERGDCQSALLALETCMALLERSPSELTRRYALFNVSCTVQQLCQKLAFEPTNEQMSMLLSMTDENAVHYSLLRILPALCAHVQATSRNAVQPASRLVMDYLAHNFCQYDISAQTVAEKVGLGINRTNAIIKEQTGMSCKAYLTSLRVERAKKLLEETTVPVMELCAQVGYSSASHFIKVFKAATGCTPDAYRRQAKGESPE